MIKKFNEFLTEEIGDINIVLDKLIDDDGNILNISGYILNKVGKIVDKYWNSNDPDINHEYPAGIDKNGKLKSSIIPRPNGTIQHYGHVLTNPENGSPWNVNTNYLSYISLLPTGWVNVKIDMEVIKKIKRFVKNIYHDPIDPNGVQAFDRKLEMISDPSRLIRRGSSDTFTERAQQQISAVMLLRYISEIKDYFNPSMSGFLFESFIGGLLPAIVPDDNGYCDAISENGYKFQIKFLTWNTSTIKLNYVPNDNREDSKRCDYFIIALKEHNKIHIWRLSNNDLAQRNLLTEGGSLSVPNLKKIDKKAILDLSIIDILIDDIAINLRESVGGIWEEISKLQYNVETILTGVDKDHNIIDDRRTEIYYRSAKDNLDNLNDGLYGLKRVLGWGG